MSMFKCFNNYLLFGGFLLSVSILALPLRNPTRSHFWVFLFSHSFSRARMTSLVYTTVLLRSFCLPQRNKSNLVFGVN